MGLAVLVAVPVGISAPARAGESPMPAAKTVRPEQASTAESVAATQAQDALHGLVDRIVAADRAGKSRSVSTRGLAGVVLEPDRNLLNLYWRGGQSNAVTSVITSGRSQGLQVKIHAARFTLAQLTAEQDRIATKYMSKTKATGFKVTSVGPKPDGSGLVIGVSPNAKARAKARSAIRSSVAFTIVAGDNLVGANRYRDTQPYWGGSYAENWGPIGEGRKGACTMGFSARRRNSSGALLPVMLTAGHCGLGGEVWRLSDRAYYGQEQEFTTAGHDNDALLVGVPTNQGFIYDGESFATGDTNFGKPVVGSAATYVGDRLCTSGSYSGTVCNIRAMLVGQTISVGGYGTVKNTVMADQQDGIAPIGNGDSGGPVFALTGANNSQTIARGTISAYPSNKAYWRPCRGVPGAPNDQPGRHCSYRFYFPDIRFQLSAYPGTTIVTG